jgi:hypothetical protein
MILKQTPPDACHLYKIPYNAESTQHWEFFYRKLGLNNRAGIPIIVELVEAIDCNNNKITIDPSIYANLGGSGNDYIFHFKNMNPDIVEDMYIHWKIVWDDGYSIDLYSDWFRREHCNVSVGILKPCIDVDTDTTDINGDFLGEYELDFTNIGANPPILPRPVRQLYSPQLYLRCGKFYMDGFEYEMKKVAKKIVKVTKKDKWSLDTEEVGSNYISTVNSVLGFARIFDFANDRIFNIEEMTIPLKSKYMKHKYYTITAVAYDITNRVKGCGTQCYIADTD